MIIIVIFNLELLNKLLNETDQYNVVKWSENWTRDGKFKIFIIFRSFQKNCRTLS